MGSSGRRRDGGGDHQGPGGDAEGGRVEVHPLERAELRHGAHQEHHRAAGQDGRAQLPHQVPGRQDGECRGEAEVGAGRFTTVLGGMR